MKRTLLVAGLLAAALAPAQAQTFPNRPIKILVGFPAGGPSDVPARIIGDKLQKSLGQPVVVENKTGAAGMIALNEHKVSDLLAGIDLTSRWAAMDKATPLGMAVKELQKPRIQLVVGIDGKSGKVTGAVIRAHRRY